MTIPFACGTCRKSINAHPSSVVAVSTAGLIAYIKLDSVPDVIKLIVVDM